MAGAWPGIWAKTEFSLLLFPKPFSLFSCEAKTGSLSNEQIARLWGLKLNVPWNESEASLGNRSPLRALSPLQPCRLAQENVILCLELIIKASQSTPTPFEKRVTQISNDKQCFRGAQLSHRLVPEACSEQECRGRARTWLSA